MERRKTMKSLRIRLVGGFILITLFLSFLLLFISTYAIGIVRQQVSASYTNMARLYLEQLDQQLTDAEKHLALVINYNKDIHTMRDGGNQNEIGKAKVAFLNQMQNDLAQYSCLDSLFLYIPKNETYLQISVDTLPYYDKNHELPSSIRKDIAENTISQKSWLIYPHHEHFFLIRLVSLNGIYFGAWINTADMNPPTSLVSLGEDFYSFFTLEDGTVLTKISLLPEHAIVSQASRQTYVVDGQRQGFQSISYASQKAPFSLNLLIPEKNILNRLPALRNMSVVLLIITLVGVIPYSFMMISQSTLRPLGQLVTAMKKIKNGNLDIRIRQAPSSAEFEVVFEVFNSMVSQLQALNTSARNESLSSGEQELYILQKQYNPHFLINSLNILHSMVQTKEYASAEEMIRYLVSYFRFAYSHDFLFVLLRQEMEHCKNYLQIQQMRYRERLSYTIYMPNYLSDIPVPPLIIQSFIENAIKYALKPDRPLIIRVNVDFVETEGNTLMKIVIQDNGDGFPEEQLHPTDLLTANKADSHVGIPNVRRRLALIYSGRASLRLYNQSGAVVEIILPMDVDIAQYSFSAK